MAKGGGIGLLDYSMQNTAKIKIMYSLFSDGSESPESIVVEGTLQSHEILQRIFKHNFVIGGDVEVEASISAIPADAPVQRAFDCIKMIQTERKSPFEIEAN